MRGSMHQLMDWGPHRHPNASIGAPPPAGLDHPSPPFADPAKATALTSDRRRPQPPRVEHGRAQGLRPLVLAARGAQAFLGRALDQLYRGLELAGAAPQA